MRRRIPSAAARRTRRIAYVVVALLLAAFIGDAAYASLRIAAALTDAKASLQRGRAAFENGDLTGAADEFDVALDKATEASAAGDQPALALGAHIPGIGNDAAALRSLSRAGVLAAQAGQTAVRSGKFVGVQAEGLAETLYSHGQVQLTRLSSAAPLVDRLSSLVEEANNLVQSAPTPLLGVLQDALSSSRADLSDASTSAQRAQALIGSLPQLLGADSKKEYLLAFQALGEARATGGLVGLYGVLNAEDGRLNLVHVGPVKDVFPDKIDPPVSAPSWFENAYGPQSALEQIQQFNVSPNFPAASEVMLRMYESASGDRLDGVLAMDPRALEDLLPGTGPLQVDGITVDETNAGDVLMRDSYDRFATPDAQNAFIGKLVDQFWQRVKDGKVQGPALAKGLGHAVATQHLKVYSADPADQDALATLGADGSYDSEGSSVQMVFNNNYGLNKVDYFLKKKIETEIQLTPQGDARIKTTAVLHNDAPRGPKSTLLGRGKLGLAPGENRMILSFLLPKDAKSGEITTIDGETKRPFSYRDDGYPVPWELIDVEPQTTVTTTLEYVAPRARLGVFDFVLFPQASAQPDDYEVTVTAPDGYAIDDLDDDSGAKETLSFSGTLEEIRHFQLEVVPLG